MDDLIIGLAVCIPVYCNLYTRYEKEIQMRKEKSQNPAGNETKPTDEGKRKSVERKSKLKRDPRTRTLARASE